MCEAVEHATGKQVACSSRIDRCDCDTGNGVRAPIFSYESAVGATGDTGNSRALGQCFNGGLALVRSAEGEGLVFVAKEQVDACFDQCCETLFKGGYHKGVAQRKRHGSTGIVCYALCF